MHIYAVHVVHTCMHTTFMNVCDYIHVLQYIHTCFIKHFTKSNTVHYMCVYIAHIIAWVDFHTITNRYGPPTIVEAKLLNLRYYSFFYPLPSLHLQTRQILDVNSHVRHMTLSICQTLRMIRFWHCLGPNIQSFLSFFICRLFSYYIRLLFTSILHASNDVALDSMCFFTS